MADLGLTQFNQIFPMLIRKYDNLIIDQNANERDKINQIINKLNALGKLSNDVVKNWNVVYNWAMNDGLTTDVSNKIETMKTNGELTTILQGIFNSLTGDMTTLHTTAQDTLVNSINEVDDLAKSNQTKLGDLTTLQTTDKDTIVHAINDNVSALAQKATDYVLVSNYTDLQSAINDAQSKSKNVNLNNQTVNIGGNISIPSNVKVYNGVINFTALASVQLTGTNPHIEDVTIQANSYSQWDTGVISLIATTGATIKNVTINGNLKGIGLYCKTQATNTIVKGLTITGSLSYGILFNDAQSQQPAGYRTVNGVDYSSLSIGSGLIIQDYTYNNTSTDNTNYFGDGIELNCPDHGFSDVTILNANISNSLHKNTAGSASGIGIGMANCSSINVSNVKVKGAQYFGIHFEAGSKNILVTNFLVDSSYTGIELASIVTNAIFKTGIVTNCTQWFIQTDNTGTNPISNIDLEDVIFDTNVTNISFPDQTIKGIHMSNASNLHFKNIRCQNFSANDTIMRLGLSEFNSSLNDVYNSVFENIFFIKGSIDITTQLLKLGAKSTGCDIQNMKKIGYTNDLGFLSENGNTIQPLTNTQLTGLTSFSGDGSTNWFTIPHKLGTRPSYMNAVPYNSATGTAGIDHITADATNMTIFTKTAPVAGTNNVSYYWMVSLR